MPSKKQFPSREAYNEYYRKYREKNRERMRKYNREYNKLYRKKHGYKNEEKWGKAHPIKVHAEHLVRYAIKVGKIKRKPCVLCGIDRVVAHHPNYRKPLEIIFLCHAHHREVHYGKRKTIKL